MPDTPLHLTTMAVALASGPAAVGALAGVGCFLGVGLLAVLCQVPFVKVIGRTVGFIDRCVLLIALGFGSGRLHPAPGTWGSIVGVGWLLALACSMSMWIFLLFGEKASSRPVTRSSNRAPTAMIRSARFIA